MSPLRSAVTATTSVGIIVVITFTVLGAFAAAAWFLTRGEAWQIADAAGQIRRRVGGDGAELFSENLY